MATPSRTTGRHSIGRQGRRTFTILLAGSVAMAWVHEAAAQSPSLVLASVSDAWVKADGDGSNPAISADGTKVAFASLATNLDPRDRDSEYDIYVRDLGRSETELASASGRGVKGNGLSVNPALSADGTNVAFESAASNLHPADRDSTTDVYVKDLATGTITVASTSSQGIKGNGESYDAALAAGGRTVVFASSSTNLHPGDTDRAIDVYVKDLVTGEVALVSTSERGVKGNGSASTLPDISADGTRITFQSDATNLDPKDRDETADVYVKDLTTGELLLASTSDQGVKANSNNWDLSLSGSGTAVAFYSLATNLDPDDQDSFADVYVKSLVTGDITLASSMPMEKANAPSFGPDLSGDGSTVSFNSYATNLHPLDTDGNLDVYVKDLRTGGILLASVSDSGEKGNGSSNLSRISPSGRRVVFLSDATNLVPFDRDTIDDVYVKAL